MTKAQAVGVLDYVNQHGFSGSVVATVVDGAVNYSVTVATSADGTTTALVKGLLDQAESQGYAVSVGDVVIKDKPA